MVKLWMNRFFERMIFVGEKKKRDKTKKTLSSAQEVTYQREFKLADIAGGYVQRREKR